MAKRGINKIAFKSTDEGLYTCSVKDIKPRNMFSASDIENLDLLIWIEAKTSKLMVQNPDKGSYSYFDISPKYFQYEKIKKFKIVASGGSEVDICVITEKSIYVITIKFKERKCETLNRIVSSSQIDIFAMNQKCGAAVIDGSKLVVFSPDRYRYKQRAEYTAQICAKDVVNIFCVSNRVYITMIDGQVFSINAPSPNSFSKTTLIKFSDEDATAVGNLDQNILSSKLPNQWK